MAKAAPLKRSDRRQPEVHPIIPVPETADSSKSNPIHHPNAAPKKPSQRKGKNQSSKHTRAKTEKAIRNADKLAHKSAKNNLRAEKKKRAKAL